ncbi:hypothetical protein GQ457_08G031960 [Hibiscus cannabinus]
MLRCDSTLYASSVMVCVGRRSTQPTCGLPLGCYPWGSFFGPCVRAGFAARLMARLTAGVPTIVVHVCWPTFSSGLDISARPRPVPCSSCIDFTWRATLLPWAAFYKPCLYMIRFPNPFSKHIMADSLLAKLGDLTFTAEEQDVVVVTPETVAILAENFDCSLVGRVFSSTPVGGNHLIRLFRTIWKDDKKYWFALEQADPNRTIHDYSFQYMCIWVLIHNIPLSLMPAALARALGASIGKVVMTDTHLEDGNMGEFMRPPRSFRPYLPDYSEGGRTKASIWCMATCPLLKRSTSLPRGHVSLVEDDTDASVPADSPSEGPLLRIERLSVAIAVFALPFVSWLRALWFTPAFCCPRGYVLVAHPTPFPCLAPGFGMVCPIGLLGLASLCLARLPPTAAWPAAGGCCFAFAQPRLHGLLGGGDRVVRRRAPNLLVPSSRGGCRTLGCGATALCDGWCVLPAVDWCYPSLSLGGWRRPLVPTFPLAPLGGWRLPSAPTVPLAPFLGMQAFPFMSICALGGFCAAACASPPVFILELFCRAPKLNTVCSPWCASLSTEARLALGGTLCGPDLIPGCILLRPGAYGAWLCAMTLVGSSPHGGSRNQGCAAKAPRAVQGLCAAKAPRAGCRIFHCHLPPLYRHLLSPFSFYDFLYYSLYMVESLLAKLGDLNFTAKEQDAVVVVPESVAIPAEDFACSPVGRVLSSGPLDGGRVARLFRTIWKDDKRSMYKYRKQEEELKGLQDNVLKRGLWNFQKHWFALEPADPACTIHDYAFQYMCIWVRIHNIPLSLMMEALACTLGACIGKVVMTDTRLEDGNMGEFLRVLVSLDTTKPLRRCVTLSRSNAKAILCPLQYEQTLVWCLASCPLPKRVSVARPRGRVSFVKDADLPPLSPAPSVASSPPASASAATASVPAPAASDAADSVPISAPVGPASSDAPVASGCTAAVSAPLPAPSPRSKRSRVRAPVAAAG